jgi:hypothetical protein
MAKQSFQHATFKVWKDKVSNLATISYSTIKQMIHIKVTVSGYEDWLTSIIMELLVKNYVQLFSHVKSMTRI